LHKELLERFHTKSLHKELLERFHTKGLHKELYETVSHKGFAQRVVRNGFTQRVCTKSCTKRFHRGLRPHIHPCKAITNSLHNGLYSARPFASLRARLKNEYPTHFRTNAHTPL
jgi:hypothetical protein